jgi:hypothetical protein
MQHRSATNYVAFVIHRGRTPATEEYPCKPQPKPSRLGFVFSADHSSSPGLSSRVKPCAKTRTASRLRGLTPAAIPVLWLPCLQCRSLPLVSRSPLAPLNNEASSHGSIRRPDGLDPAEIRDARRIQSACAAISISVRTPAPAFFDFREANDPICLPAPFHPHGKVV